MSPHRDRNSRQTGTDTRKTETPDRQGWGGVKRRAGQTRDRHKEDGNFRGTGWTEKKSRTDKRHTRKTETPDGQGRGGVKRRARQRLTQARQKLQMDRYRAG